MDTGRRFKGKCLTRDVNEASRLEVKINAMAIDDKAKTRDPKAKAKAKE